LEGLVPEVYLAAAREATMKSILMGATLTIMPVHAIDPVLAVQALQACLYVEGLDLIGQMTPPDDVADLVLVRCEEQLEDYPGSPSGGDIMQSFLAKYTEVYNELMRRN
jgi:hypothetical protein